MKQLKRIGALVLALVMALALCATAFADDEPTNAEVTLSNGEIGGYTAADTQNVMQTGENKKVSLDKAIVVYNQDETKVWGPAITYTYDVEPGTASVSITDATTDHDPVTSVSTATLAGITTGVKVNSGDAGNSTKATGTVVWNNDELNALPTGQANTKPITLDFSAVAFQAAGVYRYTVTEKNEDASYAAAGVTKTTGTKVRYLDVYVTRSSSFTDLEANGGTAGKTAYVAADWAIYGYVCVYNDSTAIVDGDTNHAVKTNGFVDGTSDGTTSIAADKYYTYNVTLSKTLNGDATMNNHKFPFTVNITNGTVTTAVKLKTKTVEDNAAAVAGSDITGTLSATIGDPATLTGIAENPTIDHQSNIKYIGIPVGVTSGTQFSAKETNNVVGTTYQYTHQVDSNTASEAAPINYNQTSTAATLTPTANAADTTAHTVAFTNTLALISPTGVVLRVAPYVAILVAGIALLVIATRRRKNAEEEA